MNNMNENEVYALTPAGKWRAYKDLRHAHCMLIEGSRQDLFTCRDDLYFRGRAEMLGFLDTIEHDVSVEKIKNDDALTDAIWKIIVGHADRTLVDGDNALRDPGQAKRKNCGTRYIFTAFDQSIKLPKQALIIWKDCEKKSLVEEQLEARIRNNRDLRTKQCPMRIFKYYKNLLIENEALKLGVA
jgi:hypothetical protein